MNRFAVALAVALTVGAAPAPAAAVDAPRVWCTPPGSAAPSWAPAPRDCRTDPQRGILLSVRGPGAVTVPHAKLVTAGQYGSERRWNVLPDAPRPTVLRIDALTH